MPGEDSVLGNPRNELMVTLIQAKNLQVMDKTMFGGGGSSDPVVTMTIHGNRAVSTTKKKELAPVWRETFTFVVDELDETIARWVGGPVGVCVGGGGARA